MVIYMIYENIKELCKLNGLTVSKAEKDMGYARSTLSKIDKNTPGIDKLQKIADYFGVSVEYLRTGNAQKETEHSVSRGGKIPVLGYVAAGIPMYAVENVIDWEEIPEEMTSHGEYFGLIINGNSMEPRMCKGDVVIVRKQPDIESSEIGIVMINGDSGTCKKVVKHEDGLSLISFNPAYEPMFYTWKEVEELPVTILGKVIELRGKL